MVLRAWSCVHGPWVISCADCVCMITERQALALAALKQEREALLREVSSLCFLPSASTGKAATFGTAWPSL